MNILNANLFFQYLCKTRSSFENQVMAKQNSHKDLDIASNEELPTNPGPAGINHLFVVAINDYQAYQPLNNAVKDANNLVELLKRKYDFKVKKEGLIFDEQATRRNILNGLRQFCDTKKIKPNDRLLIYYSGHGYWDKITQSGFWVPVDAPKNEIEEFVANSRIREIIRNIPCRHILLISDSCFSGKLLVRGGKNLEGAFQDWERNASRWVFSSGKGIVLDGEPGENSPFATAILRILRENTQPLNIGLLADKVTKRVKFNYEQQAEAAPLQGANHDGGQFIFHLKASEKEDWNLAKEKDTEEAFQTFLNRHSSSDFAIEAQQRLYWLKEKAKLDLAKTEYAYATFITTCSFEDLRQIAKKRLIKLEDETAWKAAIRRARISDFVNYIQQFGEEGEHIDEARKRIEALREKDRPINQAQKEGSEPEEKDFDKEQQKEEILITPDNKQEETTDKTDPHPQIEKIEDSNIENGHKLEEPEPTVKKKIPKNQVKEEPFPILQSNYGKILLAGFAGGVVCLILGWLIHGLILNDFFNVYRGPATGVARENPILSWVFIGHLFYGIILAIVFGRWIFIRKLAEWAKIGAVVGFLAGSTFHLMWYSSTYIDTLTSTIVQILSFTLISTIAGVVIGWLLSYLNKEKIKQSIANRTESQSHLSPISFKIFFLATIVGAITHIILAFVIGFIFSSAIEADIGAANGIYKDLNFFLFFSAHLYWGLLLTIVIGKWADFKTFSKGAKSGFILGLLIWSSFSFIFYGSSNVLTLSGTLRHILIFALISTIVGGLIGWILGKYSTQK